MSSSKWIQIKPFLRAAREILPVKLHALEHHSLISLRVGLLPPNRAIKENLYPLFASSRLSSSHSSRQTKLLPRETGVLYAPSPTKGSATGRLRFSGPSASEWPRRGDPITRRIVCTKLLTVEADSYFSQILIFHITQVTRLWSFLEQKNKLE